MVLKCLCTLQYWIWEIILANAGFQQKSGLFSFSSEALAFLKEMKGFIWQIPNSHEQTPNADCNRTVLICTGWNFQPFLSQNLQYRQCPIPRWFYREVDQLRKVTWKETDPQILSTLPSIFMNWWWRTTLWSEITFQTFWPNCTLFWI